jgi:hypothetical protein
VGLDCRLLVLVVGGLQSVTDAGDQLSQAGAEAQQNAQTTLDGLGTKLDSMKGEAASVKDELDKAAEESDARGRTARRDEPAIGQMMSRVSPFVTGEPATDRGPRLSGMAWERDVCTRWDQDARRADRGEGSNGRRKCPRPRDAV